MTGFSMDATALKLRAIAPSFASAGEAFLEVRFRRTFEAAAIGMGICNLEGRIVEANPALARLLGYERVELVGMYPWKQSGGESDRSESAELSYARRIDELPPLEDESFMLERLCRRRDGSEFWGRCRTSLARDDRGQPAFLVVLLEDASERRRNEELLRQAEKMAAIGQLAGGVAHDFNNLLTGILLYCDLLIPELELGGPLHRYVEEIRLATEQGATLTQQLLALARKEGLGTRAIDAHEVLAGMENLLRRLIGEQIELITVCDALTATVMADAAQLRQILLNLVLNARDALTRVKTSGGKIRVSTRLTEWPRGRPGKSFADIDDQPLAVLLTVEDNGCGMSAETCARMFEPFFTTKEAGAGTGIGLGTVQRIVSELGGAIRFASALGSGTRIEVCLPAFSREPAGREGKTQDSDTHVS
ncbi:MAG: ATP-binding protein [Terriglobales bacterium]